MKGPRAGGPPFLRRLLPAMGLPLLLSGCVAARSDLPVVVYLYASVGEDGRLTNETSLAFRERINQLLNDFRRVHPRVVVRTSLYMEGDLLRQVREDTAAGLGPDLILADAPQARGLLKAGLVDPVPDDPQLLETSEATMVQRLRDPQGRLVGLPLMVLPQVACFHRRRLAASPSTLEELLQLSARGVPVGLPIRLPQLIWTAGAFGAIPGLQAAAEGGQPSAEQRQAILQWLHWLQNASNQQRVSFFPDQKSLREGLRQGSLAWISCSSAELVLLRRWLGADLGVSTLPGGPRHPATPINRLRLLSLGTNSSPTQRRAALKLIQFSGSPQEQRNLSLDSLSFLPSNPRVMVPVQSSATLRALVHARAQGTGIDRLLRTMGDEDERVQSLQEQVILPVVYGQIQPEQAIGRALAILRSGR